MNTNEEYHSRHREMVENMEPINTFDPEVEVVANELWIERGHQEHYLLEWKFITRPLREGDDFPAIGVLRDAEAIVAERRSLS